ncbi:Trans-aconitate methyltransferase [Pannonibacter phragmitetus]|uniref:Trans-aconitate methyltransferase n=1 Tax=Pannonibacter phragmitetus TaxID=121719 RepID=A0A379A1S9_9HYPH|nr:class I SAM-dependent methyltransferase [Pannonibacter phragmitetus]SUB03153.1 Trans-aconitate methyltransferase [Pannonibacter phragmitetus]
MPASSKQNAADLFRFEWGIYRKLTSSGLFGHVEVAEVLEREISARFSMPFSFLDLACGDATVTSSVLSRHPAAVYRGIDLSAMALALARDNFAGAAFPVTLEETDMLAALSPEVVGPVDVIWCGLSLHHLPQDEKRQLFTLARNALGKGGGKGGMMAVYEPVLPDGLTRDAFMARMAGELRQAWEVLSPHEFDHMWQHINSFDFPETLDGWKSLGLAAGFAQAQEVFRLTGPMPCSFIVYEAGPSH